MQIANKYFICKKCGNKNNLQTLKKSSFICPCCFSYYRMTSQDRLDMLEDPGSFKAWDDEIVTNNSDEGSEVITGQIKINEIPVAIGIMDTNYMMASMGWYVGEKVVRLFERATEKKLPVLLFCCSGGARVQEGIVSLMQMEKTSAAVERHNKSGLLYISVLTDPTMGGVTASFATQADIVIAEKGARIGFAGPRVIEQNIGTKLPKGFQSAEFQLEHGFIDKIVERENIKATVYQFLSYHSNKKNKKKRSDKYKELFYKVVYGIFEIYHRLPENALDYQGNCDNTESVWKKVKIARSINRPTSLDYITKIFTDFVELHGDRKQGDDHAIVAGLAKFHGIPVTVVGQQKGKKSFENALYRNWGMPSPMGYRKVSRLVREAEKFNRPIIFFVDTVGAACDIKAEEFGQGNAIAELLKQLSALKVPTLSIIVGEGNSGGALAMAVGNEVWMLENSVYSVLSPESYSSIIYKDNRKAEIAAESMKIKSSDLYQMGVVSQVISEPDNLSENNLEEVCNKIDAKISTFLNKYKYKTSKQIINDRYKKYRKF